VMRASPESCGNDRADGNCGKPKTGFPLSRLRFVWGESVKSKTNHRGGSGLRPSAASRENQDRTKE
jgi:hypothetical protein